MGRLHDRDCAGFDLARTSEEDASTAFSYRASYRRLLPNDLASALELFFHVDLRDRAAEFA